TESSSRRSPRRCSTPPSGGLAERLISRTAWPPATNFSTTGSPKKPVPPVTRIRIRLAPSLRAAAHASAALGRRPLAMSRDIDPVHAALQREDLAVVKGLDRFLRQARHLAVTLRSGQAANALAQLRLFEQRPNSNREVLGAGEDRALGQRLEGSPDVDRQNVDLVRQCQVAQRGLELQKLSRRRSGPFGEDQQIQALVER